MRLLRDLLGMIATGLLLSWLLVAITTCQDDARAKDRCFSAAGRVEHYDGDRPEVWRCVGLRQEEG